MGRIGISWRIKTGEQKIEDVVKYFLDPKIKVVENLINQTINNIKRCGDKIGKLQDLRDQDEIVVAESKIKKIKENIKKVQREITNIKAKKAYKNKKFKRVLAKDWENRESYLSEEEVLNYIKYGKKGIKNDR